MNDVGGGAKCHPQRFSSLLKANERFRYRRFFVWLSFCGEKTEMHFGYGGFYLYILGGIEAGGVCQKYSRFGLFHCETLKFHFD